MKKIILTTCVLLCFFIAKAQYVTIPDSNFVKWLGANGYSAALNGSLLDTTNVSVTNASVINCGSSQIADLTGIQYFKKLKQLICSFNNLTFLPANLPPDLDTIDCSFNQIFVLPTLPASLLCIDCSENQISDLPLLPGTLLNLNCAANQINNLPGLLPSSLKTLICFANLIAIIPTLPVSIIKLECGGNPLGNLPSLPTALNSLSCSTDQLNNLPALPDSLQTLICDNNSLTTLPAFPAALQFLQCQENQLTTLPPFPSKIIAVQCQINKLVSLPALPDSMGLLDISNNPDLLCLPRLNKITNFLFDSRISCVPDYGQITLSIPPIQTIPLCSDTFNPNNCVLYLAVKPVTENSNSINIYPNPASEQLTVSGEQLAVSSIEITNLLGQTLITKTPSVNSKQTVIDISSLSSGVYLLVVKNNGGVGVRKFVKE